MNYILCYSGGKDSTAMLIHLLENQKPIDEILYVDVGDWMWKCANDHLKKVEDVFDVEITKLDVSDEIQKGFERWGFPSFLNRWCTGVKRIAMREHLQDKFGGGKSPNTLVIVPMRRRELIKNYMRHMMLSIH